MVKVRIILGDITKMNVDSIVNAANESLLGGGGVDGAIHRAAGPELLEATKKLGRCPTGQAKITPGFLLKSKYIIHTPGPKWKGGQSGEDALLESSYRNCLKLAEEYKCKTVAFPSISTGVFRFPVDRAARIALQTIKEYNNNSIEEVTIVCFDDNTKAYYDRAYTELFVEKKNT